MSAEKTPVKEGFYVGYLALPKRDHRFLKWAVPLIFLAVVGLGLLIGASQRDPGAGLDEVGREIKIEGTITVNPYAILHVREDSADHAVLLVDEGKFGAAQRLQSLDGHRAILRGTLLHRGGRRMFEIADGADAVEEVRQPAPAPPHAPVALGMQTLRGEIIDPKCYLGAMKPGGGKTHKACAQLCLAGGIPPMLAVFDATGQETFYLLLHADGSAANESLSALAGESVSLTGAAEQWDDLLVLKMTAVPTR